MLGWIWAGDLRLALDWRVISSFLCHTFLIPLSINFHTCSLLFSPVFPPTLIQILHPSIAQTGKATCKKCPDKVLNALYYILLALFDIIMITITIRWGPL